MRLKQSFSKKSWMTVGIITLGTALVTGCSLNEPITQENAGQEQLVKTVKVEKITKQKIGDLVEVGAEVVSSIKREVVAKEGGDVEKIVKKRGDKVQEGEVILRLNSKDLLQQRENAVIALNNAKDTMEMAKKDNQNSLLSLARNLEEARRNYNKIRNDYDLGLVSDADLEQAKSDMRNAQTEVDSFKRQQQATMTSSETMVKNSQFELQVAELALTYLEIKAPISGLLTEMPIEAGMSLPKGGRVGQIENLDKVKLIANLSVAAAKFAHGKKELTYYTADDALHSRAAVSFLSEVIDPGSKGYELILEVPNKDRLLKPGMKVRVQLTEEKEQFVVAIPTQCIIKEGEDSYVFVMEGDIAKKRRVELGRVNEPIQEVHSGVKEGELLVISGQRQLQNQERVQIQKVEIK